jgi:PadR family transcriptional regulator PadR
MTDVIKAKGSFLAMLALKDGPKHGYDISAFIKERGGGYFSLSFGSLYPILHKLEHDGLIKGAWHEVGDKEKKVYSLTAKGRHALEGEAKTYRDMIKAFTLLMETN